MVSGAFYADRILRMFRGTTFQFTSVWISLHTSNPNSDGDAEHDWSNYKRRKVVSANWGATTGTAGTNRRIENDSTLTFSTVGTTTVGQTAVYLGVWNLSVGGSFIVGGPLNTSVALPQGVVARFLQQACDIEQD